MGRPFILAKNTRSPLKKVKGRRIPAIDEEGSLSNDSRTPSLSADKEGGFSAQMSPGRMNDDDTYSRTESQTESEPTDDRGRGGGG